MRAFPHALLRNWWVIAFILMAWAFYLQAMHKKNRLMVKLEEKVQVLDKARAEARAEKEELLLRMQSQDDPEWMELVLKEKLGVVPEGQIKVVFQ
jgi:plasmid replication initiation protein